MSKIIVFCADGTWNGPGQDENHDSVPDPTNVYKLFCALSGTFDQASIRSSDEQEKTLSEGGELVQVAKYLHGVGDSRNPFVRLMGGAFGGGIITRIVRGYTFISRHYQPGDSVVLVGFSRGAYTVRALAGMIAAQGLLQLQPDADRDQAYRKGAQAWYRYQKQHGNEGRFARLATAIADLPAFLSSGEAGDHEFVLVENIHAVAVWDTVGALGIPNVTNDPRTDSFRFADTVLHQKVANGFHAVALDEQREAFTPTLWDSREGIEQRLFPGAHADVGGGYPGSNDESGLSDTALVWMIAKLCKKGVRFEIDAGGRPLGSGIPCKPDVAGKAHQPWRKFPFNDPRMISSRSFKGVTIDIDESVSQRQAAGYVQADPQSSASTYQPQNLPRP